MFQSTTCQHLPISYCRYKKKLSVLKKDDGKMNDIRANRTTIQLMIWGGNCRQQYITNCGRNVITLVYTAQHKCSIMIFNRDIPYIHPIPTPPIYVAKINFSPSHLLVTPCEKNCLVFGSRANVTEVVHYRMNLCEKDTIFRSRGSFKLSSQSCVLHHTSTLQFRAFALTSNEIVIFTHQNHMMIYSLFGHCNDYCRILSPVNNQLCQMKDFCLKKVIHQLIGEVTNACITAHNTVLFVTSLYQLFEFCLKEFKLKSSVTLDQGTANWPRNDLVLQKLFPYPGKIEFFFVCSYVTRTIYSSAKINNSSIVKLKKIPLSEVVGCDISSWYIKNFLVDDATGNCAILFHTYDQCDVYDVFCFNILNANDKKCILKFSDLGLFWPQILINWRSKEVLLSDCEGRISGYRIPINSMSLANLSKTTISSTYNRDEIHSLNIPRTLIQYLLC